ncbi:MAG: TonB-dependent receptor [Gemmatimonadetes bacterium]|nr:TonB-dependent receptor [Gemmatimonadota bacterium]
MRRAAGTITLALCLAGVRPADAAAVQDTTATGDTLTSTADTLRHFRRPVLVMTEAEAPLGPLPPGSRYRFTRESIIWTSSLTLSDLLTEIPGVYVARAGFFGQPEYVMYAGRGAQSIEIFWDGLPLHPVGPDSVYLDPARFNLSYLRQVEVEVLPAKLRVYLVSERHESPDPRSVLRVTSGSFNTAQYAGLFQRRWASGVALNLAGDYTASDGGPNAGRNDQYLDLWAKLEWLLPDAPVGVAYQIRRQGQERDPRVAEGGLGVPARSGTRTEYLLKIFTGNRTDGLGWRGEAGVGSTKWGSDSLPLSQSVRQAYTRVRFARPSFSLEAVGRVADTRVRSALETKVGWVPLSGVVLAGEARWQRFTADRTARSFMGSAGLYRGPLSLTGQFTTGELLHAPAILTDSIQEVDDASVRVGLTTTVLSGSVGLARRDAFLPGPIPDLPDYPAMDSSVAATYIIADVQFRPIFPLFFTARYSHPRTKSADLQPPKHGRGEITFRSKFWRTFRSGVFDFMVRYSFEFWSAGTAGLNAAGIAVELPGATFQEWFVQVQLVGFKVFWNLRNARQSTAQYIPGLTYPRNAQTFGVKWEFTN